MRNLTEEQTDIQAGNFQIIIRVLFVVFLAAGIVIEVFFIAALRDEIDTQLEETKKGALQLQFLKSERESLNEKLISVNRVTGERKNGTSADR
jgi:hypothetical protein